MPEPQTQEKKKDKDPHGGDVITGGMIIIYYHDGTHQTLPAGYKIEKVDQDGIIDKIPTGPVEGNVFRVVEKTVRAMALVKGEKKPALTQRDRPRQG